MIPVGARGARGGRAGAPPRRLWKEGRHSTLERFRRGVRAELDEARGSCPRARARRRGRVPQPARGERRAARRRHRVAARILLGARRGAEPRGAGIHITRAEAHRFKSATRRWSARASSSRGPARTHGRGGWPRGQRDASSAAAGSQAPWVATSATARRAKNSSSSPHRKARPAGSSSRRPASAPNSETSESTTRHEALYLRS